MFGTLVVKPMGAVLTVSKDWFGRYDPYAVAVAGTTKARTRILLTVANTRLGTTSSSSVSMAKAKSGSDCSTETSSNSMTTLAKQSLTSKTH